jgi:hypothetical protein
LFAAVELCRYTATVNSVKETMSLHSKTWDSKGGLLAFQQHIQSSLTDI